ncbi:MAG: hypothetical protein ACRYGM_28400 [Janthinobacterium lividum]
MSNSLARRVKLPELSRRWTTLDGAAAQGDRAQGTQAAREDGPGGNAALALDRFWRGIAAEGSGALLTLYAESAALLREQTERRDRLRVELETDLVQQAAANQRQHDEGIATLRRDAGPDAARYKASAGRAEEAQKALRAVRGEVNSRPLRTQMGWFYIVAMVVFAVAEVPVNRAAFELTFREEPIYALLLAFAVGSIFIFFAHVIGILLRQWPRRPSLAQVLVRLGTLAALLAVVIGSVAAMARMRQAFMRLASAENDGFAQRLQEALRGGTQSAVSVLTDQPLGVSDWAFIAVNVMIFAFGAVASFLRHDPHPDYERAIRDGRRTEAAFAKIERRHAGQVRTETSRYEDRKRSLETQMGELSAGIAALSDQAASLRELCFTSREMVAQTVRKRCLSFIEGFGLRPAGQVLERQAQLQAPSLEAIMAELPQPRTGEA